jgi:hypothetical protein
MPLLLLVCEHMVLPLYILLCGGAITPSVSLYSRIPVPSAWSVVLQLIDAVSFLVLMEPFTRCVLLLLGSGMGCCRAADIRAFT